MEGDVERTRREHSGVEDLNALKLVLETEFQVPDMNYLKVSRLFFFLSNLIQFLVKRGRVSH